MTNVPPQDVTTIVIVALLFSAVTLGCVVVIGGLVARFMRSADNAQERLLDALLADRGVAVEHTTFKGNDTRLNAGPGFRPTPAFEWHPKPRPGPLTGRDAHGQEDTDDRIPGGVPMGPPIGGGELTPKDVEHALRNGAGSFAANGANDGWTIHTDRRPVVKRKGSEES